MNWRKAQQDFDLSLQTAKNLIDKVEVSGNQLETIDGYQAPRLFHAMDFLALAQQANWKLDHLDRHYDNKLKYRKQMRRIERLNNK